MSRCYICLKKLEQKTLPNGNVVITDSGYHKVKLKCSERGKAVEEGAEDVTKELYVCKECFHGN